MSIPEDIRKKTNLANTTGHTITSPQAATTIYHFENGFTGPKPIQ
jgi:transposase